MSLPFSISQRSVCIDEDAEHAAGRAALAAYDSRKTRLRRGGGIRIGLYITGAMQGNSYVVSELRWLA